jgi:hypothetical protein
MNLLKLLNLWPPFWRSQSVETGPALMWHLPSRPAVVDLPARAAVARLPARSAVVILPGEDR